MSSSTPATRSRRSANRGRYQLERPAPDLSRRDGARREPLSLEGAPRGAERESADDIDKRWPAHIQFPPARFGQVTSTRGERAATQPYIVGADHTNGHPAAANLPTKVGACIRADW